MNHTTLVVVADKFVEFTTDKQAITVSHLWALLEVPNHILPGSTRLIRGQGVSDELIHELVTRIQKIDPAGARWDLSAMLDQPQRADSSLSHKHETCNTIICSPKQRDEDSFLIDVCIDQDCELMRDHQTGQHIQGMVLIEAARQAFLAVSSKFFPHETSDKTYFVINSMATDFKGFVFPLQMYIDYKILNKKINKKLQSFDVEMDFIQGGEVKATNKVSFMVYPNEMICNKEKMLAIKAFEVAVNKTTDSAIDDASLANNMVA